MSNLDFNATLPCSIVSINFLSPSTAENETLDSALYPCTSQRVHFVVISNVVENLSLIEQKVQKMVKIID